MGGLIQGTKEKIWSIVNDMRETLIPYGDGAKQSAAREKSVNLEKGSRFSRVSRSEYFSKGESYVV